MPGSARPNIRANRVRVAEWRRKAAEDRRSLSAWFETVLSRELASEPAGFPEGTRDLHNPLDFHFSPRTDPDLYQRSLDRARTLGLSWGVWCRLVLDRAAGLS